MTEIITKQTITVKIVNPTLISFYIDYEPIDFVAILQTAGV